FCERGNVLQPQHCRGIVGQHQIVTLIIAMHDRPNVLAAHLRRGIDVRDESDHRNIGLRRCSRNGAEDISMLIDRDFPQSDRIHLLDEQPQQVELLRRTWVAGTGLIRLSVDFDVAKKAFEDSCRGWSSGHAKEYLSGRLFYALLTLTSTVWDTLPASRTSYGGKGRASLIEVLRSRTLRSHRPRKR